MWTHTQFENETEIFGHEVTFRDAVGFYTRINELCRKYKNDQVLSRALDIGCCMGRTTFDLALFFDEVIGIDTSVKSIEKANQLKRDGRLNYSLCVEGDITKEYVAIVNPDIDRNQAHFQVGDACYLPSDLGQFGMIVALNTIHHVADPKRFLTNVKNYLVPGGILVIAEIYSWHEMLELPKDQWVAGYVKENGEEVHGADGLKDVLSPSFELLEQKEMQVISQWKGRMYMLAFPEVTVWKKK